MKLKAALKKVKTQLGVDMTANGQMFFGKYKDRVFSFCINGRREDDNDVICFHSRRVDDEHDWQSDYHAGRFFDNLTQLINRLKEY